MVLKFAEAYFPYLGLSSMDLSIREANGPIECFSSQGFDNTDL